MSTTSLLTEGFTRRQPFRDVDWSTVPDQPGVYLIYDLEELVYIGMAGRNGRGSLRNRLRDHSTGQIVNMFAQYLFLARVQFIPDTRITHPRNAKSECKRYIAERCTFCYVPAASAAEARQVETTLKARLQPTLNP